MATLSSTQKLIDNARIIDSKGPHRHSIIWLHGFGDSADGAKGLFMSIPVPNTRIVLPNAPKQWVTIQGRRYHVQSWYEHDENRFEILESIKELIDDELKLVENASQIIIGGFRYIPPLSLSLSSPIPSFFQPGCMPSIAHWFNVCETTIRWCYLCQWSIGTGKEDSGLVE